MNICLLPLALLTVLLLPSDMLGATSLSPQSTTDFPFVLFVKPDAVLSRKGDDFSVPRLNYRTASKPSTDPLAVVLQLGKPGKELVFVIAARALKAEASSGSWAESECCTEACLWWLKSLHGERVPVRIGLFSAASLQHLGPDQPLPEADMLSQWIVVNGDFD